MGDNLKEEGFLTRETLSLWIGMGEEPFKISKDWIKIRRRASWEEVPSLMERIQENLGKEVIWKN